LIFSLFIENAKIEKYTFASKGGYTTLLSFLYAGYLAHDFVSHAFCKLHHGVGAFF